MGRIIRDPELKTTPSDIPVCSFTVAVDRRFQKSGEERQTDFINVVAWRQTAEFVSRYFGKGRMINVVGSLQTRAYEDAEGKKRYITEVVAEEINFCGDKKTESQTNDGFDNQGFTAIYADDDFPF